MKKNKSIVFLSFILFLSLTSCEQKEKKHADGTPVVENISAQDLYAIKQDILLIDVRTPQEYRSGHIENAINIDYSGAGFKTEISKFPKDQEVYLYCKTGIRSSRAARILEDMGYTKVYNLKGGILSWQNSQLPVNK